MSGLIEGNIDNALGFGVMEIEGLKINLHLTTAKDLITFQTLPMKYLKSKEVTTEESVALQEGYRESFIKYLMDKDPSLAKDKIELLVAKYVNRLLEEFPIATGMKTRKEMDDLKKSISDKQKN